MKELTSTVLVVGAGISGLTTALSLADMGAEVTLIDRRDHPGGNAAEWACMATTECAKCSACQVEDTIRKVSGHSRIHLFLRAEAGKLEGQKGAFRVQLKPTDSSSASPRDLKEETTLACQSIVLATGFEPFDATEKSLLGYKMHPEVLTIPDVDEALKENRLESVIPTDCENPKIAFVQCVGSRDHKIGHNYCSQFCCKASIRLARRLKHLRPDADLTIYYIDLQLMGKEFRDFYANARKDINFMQGVPAEILHGEEPGMVRVYGTDSETGESVPADYHRMVLAVGISPQPGNEALAAVFGVQLNEHGFFTRSANGASTDREGIFLAGAATGPTDIVGSRLQAQSVAKQIAMSLDGFTNNAKVA